MRGRTHLEDTLTSVMIKWTWLRDPSHIPLSSSPPPSLTGIPSHPTQGFEIGASDCHGFQNPCGLRVGSAGVRVQVGIIQPSLYPYPWARVGGFTGGFTINGHQTSTPLYPALAQCTHDGLVAHISCTVPNLQYIYYEFPPVKVIHNLTHQSTPQIPNFSPCWTLGLMS